MERLDEITADDVIRSGACASGVYEVLNRLHPNINSLMNVNDLLHLLKEDEKRYVIEAAMMDGYGYGNGNGDGYGSGNGDGE